MSQTNISVRIDENIKEQFSKLCDELGFTMSTLINVFIRRAIREQGVPFAVSINDYNSETKKAIEEAENGIGLSGPFDNVEDLMHALLKDDENV